jgi:hypothetical protein
MISQNNTSYEKENIMTNELYSTSIDDKYHKISFTLFLKMIF